LGPGQRGLLPRCVPDCCSNGRRVLGVLLGGFEKLGVSLCAACEGVAPPMSAGLSSVFPAQILAWKGADACVPHRVSWVAAFSFCTVVALHAANGGCSLQIWTNSRVPFCQK
jgi:hypothetical protein